MKSLWIRCVPRSARCGFVVLHQLAVPGAGSVLLQVFDRVLPSTALNSARAAAGAAIALALMLVLDYIEAGCSTCGTHR